MQKKSSYILRIRTFSQIRTFLYYIFNRLFARGTWNVCTYKHRFCKGKPTTFSFNKQGILLENSKCSSHSMHASLHDSFSIDSAASVGYRKVASCRLCGVFNRTQFLMQCFFFLCFVHVRNRPIILRIKIISFPYLVRCRPSQRQPGDE